MTRFRTVLRLAVLAAFVALPAACGARGGPLPPLRIVPATILAPEATRMAGRVYLEFTAPDRDSEETPGDVAWIEVYAVTTQPTDRRPREEFSEDWLDVATLVAVLPVRLPDTQPTDPPPELADLLDEVRNRDAVHGPVAFFEVAQGEEVTVVERLTPETLAPVTVGDPDEEDEEEEEEDEDPDRILPMPFVPPPTPAPAIRSYVAFGVSSRGRPGEPSALAEVPLVTPPPPPGPAAVTYTATAVDVTWERPPTFRLAVQAVEVEPPALASTPVLEGQAPSEYVVYDLAASGDPDVERPARLAAPRSDASFTAGGTAFPETRCYAVRVLDHVDSGAPAAVAASNGLQILGDASPATCVVLTDTFPPAAPAGLIAVADANGISLVWDENAEDDLAGYRVLRGTPPDATLQPLTDEPIAGTAYQDADVTGGVRYVYRVVAVDTAVPPNASPPSAPVTEIARQLAAR